MGPQEASITAAGRTVPWVHTGHSVWVSALSASPRETVPRSFRVTWRENHFTAIELSHSSLSDDTADTDGDGTRRVTIRDRLPMAGQCQRFLRLQVSPQLP